MIRLKPIPEAARRECPNCRAILAARGFAVTGMRNLAALVCPRCEAEFYADLPAGQGLYTPILLDKKAGAVYDDYDARWFSEWLADAYARRTNEPLAFETKKFSPVKNTVVLLNCLDTLYGHSLLKLLNADYYLNRADVDLIILAPKFLEWMLPDRIAEAWIVDLPLKRGTEWNDWLAAEIDARLAPYDEVFLSVAFSHPRAEDFSIENFTRVAPFPLDQWKARLENPRATFIWRDDRLWETEDEKSPNRFERAKRRFGKSRERANEQLRKVITLAECLRGEIANVDFAVAGIGETGGLPGWIKDLRLEKIGAGDERALCERYARSHVVAGVHGSNMLLPSAHAGAVLEIIGEERQGNFLQDILFRGSDAREMFFRYRFAPPSISPEELARLMALMFRYEDFRQLMGADFCAHRENYDFAEFLSERRQLKEK